MLGKLKNPNPLNAFLLLLFSLERRPYVLVDCLIFILAVFYRSLVGLFLVLFSLLLMHFLIFHKKKNSIDASYLTGAALLGVEEVHASPRV